MQPASDDRWDCIVCGSCTVDIIVRPISLHTPIGFDDTAGSVHDRLAELAAELAPSALQGLADGSLRPHPQPEEGVTYAHKLGPEDQKVDWSRPAREVDCQIRGLSPFPGAWCDWVPPGADAPVRLKLLGCRRSGRETSAPPGTVLDDRLLVACGDGGAVRITRLQKPGGKPMDAETFLNGQPIPPDTVLS